MTQVQIRATDEPPYRFQCYRTESGIDRVDVGPAHDTPREAIEYSDLMAARASRPRFDDSAGAGAPTSGDERAETEASDHASLVVGSCAWCGRDLPPGSRPQRRTCSGACRRALARSLTGRNAEEAPEDEETGVARSMSQFPAAHGPSPRPGAEPTLPAPDQGAGTAASPGHGSVPTLGLL